MAISFLLGERWWNPHDKRGERRVQLAKSGRRVDNRDRRLWLGETVTMQKKNKPNKAAKQQARRGNARTNRPKLTNAQLLRLAAKHRLPQSWYDDETAFVLIRAVWESIPLNYVR